MLATLATLDYLVIVVYLLAMVALGVWFSGIQKSTQEFFLASRSLGWFPLGMSLMATLISALTFTGLPAQAYEVGWKTIIIPLSVWIALPFIVWFVLPIYRGLGLSSIYEYLELRFDAQTRLLGSGLFVVWRLLWLGGVIYAPCKALAIATDWPYPTWPLLLGLGLITTLYTFLGGMKAVVWTDVIQGMAMLLGVAVIIGGVWLSLPGGAGRVWEVAQGLERDRWAEFRFSVTDRWSLWGALPHWVLAMLSFYVADQITAQRFLCANTLAGAQRSYVLNCVVLSLLMPGLTYVGLCLLAFYYDHPQRLDPKWVASVNHLAPHDSQKNPQSGEPLLSWKNPAQTISPQTAAELVQQRRIMRPNSDQPFTDAAEFTDPDTGEIQIEKLAMRASKRPEYKPGRRGSSPNTMRGEVILHRRAGEELLPKFIAKELPWGAAGLILAALLAASMSSIDSGLNSICSLLVIDLHGRFGLGKAWLARVRKKSVAELNDEDELRLAQPLTFVVGVAATLAALFMAQLGDVFDMMIAVANTLGAPLLAIFLLGMLTHKTTALAARYALLGGTLVTMWLMLAARYKAVWWLWPWETHLHDIWTVTLGTLTTMGLGYGLSFFVGEARTKSELRGLVIGLGKLGVQRTQEEIPLITPPEDAAKAAEAATDKTRWS